MVYDTVYMMLCTSVARSELRARTTTFLYIPVHKQVSTYAIIWPSQRLPNCSVVAVSARDAVRAADFARWHRIPRSYGSYDDLLADPEVDAVYIGLPNGLHGYWAKRYESGYLEIEKQEHVLNYNVLTALLHQLRLSGS